MIVHVLLQLSPTTLGFVPGSIGPTALSGLLVTHNDVQGPSSLPLVNHGIPMAAGAEHWEFNRCDCDPQAAATFGVADYERAGFTVAG